MGILMCACMQALLHQRARKEEEQKKLLLLLRLLEESLNRDKLRLTDNDSLLREQLLQLCQACCLFFKCS